MSKENQSRLIYLVVGTLGVLIALPAQFYRATQTVGTHPLDISWIVDLPARLRFGELAGRDFIHNHGLLFQLLHAPGMLWNDGDLASLMRYHATLEIIIATLGVLVMFSLTGSALGWRLGYFLIWAMLLGVVQELDGAYLKPLGGLFACVACGRSFELDRRRHWLTEAVCWGFPVPLLFFYALDIAALTLAALVASLALLVIVSFSLVGAYAKLARMTALRCFAWLVAGVIVLIVLLSLIPGFESYMVDSWRFALGYSAVWAFPGHSLWLAVLACVLVLNGLIGLWVLLRIRSRWVHRTKVAGLGAVLMGLVFSSVWLRYPLTRTDLIHVFDGLLSSILVIGYFIPLFLIANRRFLSAGVISITLIPAFFWLGWVQVGSLDDFPGLRHLELRRAHFRIEDPTMRQAVAVLSQAPQQRAYVWPYETIAALIARKASVGFTVQSHTALLEAFQLATITNLESRPQLPVVLFTRSLAVDGVSNISRSSVIFRFLIENYRISDSDDGLLVLSRRDQRRLCRSQRLTIPSRSFAPSQGQLTANLLPYHCRFSDLFVIRVRIARTRLYGVAKPGWLLGSFRISNGDVRTYVLPVPPDGNSHDILVTAADLTDPGFLSYFGSGEFNRSKERVLSFRLEWRALDWLSRTPESVTLEAIEVLNPERS